MKELLCLQLIVPLIVCLIFHSHAFVCIILLILKDNNHISSED